MKQEQKMSTEKKNLVFDEDCSKNYDRYWVKLSAMNDALYLPTRVILSGLPGDAHILCVGAGTGK
jgi:tRNA (cmo5U34)-methyltransferase